MSLATNVFPCLHVGFLVWKQMHDLRRKIFLLAAVSMWEAYVKEFFFFSLEHGLWKELNHNFFYYVLDIWMDLISDLVTNGLARLNLPLELNFLCIELCQKNYHSIFLMRASHVTQLFALFWFLWFSMHYFHENVVVDISLWWIPHIIQKNSDFSWFSKTSMQTCCKADIDLW